MCCEVPGPADPNVIVPGLLFASAISSCTFLAEILLLLTATAIGMLVAIDTPTKAVPKS